MNILALIAGGLAGTILRYELGEWIPQAQSGFPFATLFINLLGCLFLGWFFTATSSHLKVSPQLRLGLGTGMTGAFTTFSTFSVQTVDLIQKGHPELSAFYVLASIVGGLALTFVGVGVGKIKFKGLGMGGKV